MAGRIRKYYARSRLSYLLDSRYGNLRGLRCSQKVELKYILTHLPKLITFMIIEYHTYTIISMICSGNVLLEKYHITTSINGLGRPSIKYYDNLKFPSRDSSLLHSFSSEEFFCLCLNIKQLDALNIIISLFQASTCFEHMCSTSAGQKLCYTVLSQSVHRTATHTCDDTRDCIIKFLPS